MDTRGKPASAFALGAARPGFPPLPTALGKRVAFPTFPQRRRLFLHKNRKPPNPLKCYLCARIKVLPMCRSVHLPVGFMRRPRCATPRFPPAAPMVLPDEAVQRGIEVGYGPAHRERRGTIGAGRETQSCGRRESQCALRSRECQRIRVCAGHGIRNRDCVAVSGREAE